ncbi:hypothetical protein pb186bvf_013970 [Paramecium bursaria]
MLSHIKSNKEICFDLISCSLQMVIGYICIDLMAAISLHYLSSYGSNIQVAGFGFSNLLNAIFILPFGFGLNQSLNQQNSQAGSSKISPILLNFTFYTHALYFIPLGTYLYCLQMKMHKKQLNMHGSHFPLIVIGWLIASEFEALKVYLLPQKVFTPFAVIHFITLALHAFWCYVLVNILENKVIAVCLSIIISELSNHVLFYIYLMKTQQIGYFQGLTFSFIIPNQHDLYQTFIQTTIPQVLHIYSNIIGILGLSVIALGLGTDDFNAQLGMSNTAHAYFRIPLSISITLMSFVGQQLGQGNVQNAKQYFKMGVAMYFSLIFFSTSLFFIYTKEWADFYSANTNVSQIMEDALLPFLINFVCCDGLQMIIAGVIKGLNKGQWIGTQVLIAYLGIGIPLEIYFAYTWDQGVKGIWVGFGIANCQILLFFIQTMSMIDWEKQSQEIQNFTQAQTELVDLKKPIL